ncbi:MAG: glucose-6-phosphate dehydrogenase assembly protein OpcA [Cephaloticoccus sp.]|nr:glucose-6-phosphate dehydrogenase assembly protein OpcA [Cephaloticoccus sp.]MCF7761601.1 glucose-6-phosphate dehydrogenase assembly protein OpcA [Cephaloticoccus sp.]
MSSIFNSLPGLDCPVGEISKRLADMWVDTAASGGPAPTADDAKATQVNLVLHLGYATTEEDAANQFQTAVRFSRRYPSRIVVLCPMHESNDKGGTEIRAKIYGECHLGKTKSDKRCVEFVLLCYSRAARIYLENQVSICLSTDLPLYYWAHRFSASAKLADYRFLLSRSKRVLIDSAIAPADVTSYPWPNPLGLRDLVYSRLLPVRQTVGQFLASYPAAKLIEGLATITVTRGDELAAEGRVMAAWLKRRLTASGAADLNCVIEAGPTGRLGVVYDYADHQRHFRWSGDLQTGQALFECNLGGGMTKLPASVSLLSPEAALSEAMFL